MTKLTARQPLILGYIRRYVTVNGYPPTIREIGDNFAMSSTNGVHCHLASLKRKGAVDWVPGACRTLRVLP